MKMKKWMTRELHVEVVAIPPLRRASTIPDLFLRSQRNPPQIDYLPTLAPLSPKPPMHSMSLGAIQTLLKDVCIFDTLNRGHPSSPRPFGNGQPRERPQLKSTRSLHSIKSKDKTTSSDITWTNLRLPTKPKTSHYPPVFDLRSRHPLHSRPTPGGRSRRRRRHMGGAP